jgi:uncharacterized protein YjeT (DUF2065 family)
MRDLLTAMALVLVLEGVAWSLFPTAMKRAAMQLAGINSSGLRLAGLCAASAGVLAVWLIRG